MGRQAGAAAAQAGHDGELPEPSDPLIERALPARTRSASRAPAPAPARQLFTPPGLGPRPPGSRPASGPSHYASAELDPHPAAPARARQLTRDCLTRWDMDALTNDAVTIASEMTTNAIAAVPPDTTGLAIVYAIHATPTAPHIYTWDIGPGHPQPAPPDPDSTAGRGLTIIDALSHRNWGWWPTPISGGKVVWSALPAPDDTDDDGPQDSPC